MHNAQKIMTIFKSRDFEIITKLFKTIQKFKIQDCMCCYNLTTRIDSVGFLDYQSAHTKYQIFFTSSIEQQLSHENTKL
jgi:hypothetical protein